MALKFFDRTKQDATTTGTGTFTLATSASTGGFRTFASVHTTGDEVFYCAVDNVNNTFEVGQGTLTSGSPSWTLTRDTIKSSSNSNNAVNFAAAPEIFSTYPAANAAFSDTSLASNVVQTDDVFTETLTANKALSGQFKGTLQFNKAFFTSTDYTITSGRTLTVTDSADLYAVDIASGTVMDRTADFTDDVTISANTMFSPGINAYATVTVANGITATVSPVGTTFVNNGAGISTGGPISWKLPTVDGSADANITTDGKGGFKVAGSSSGVATLTPKSETLIYVGDFNNYKPDANKNYVEFIVPDSVATNASDIESFRIVMDFLSFRNGTNGTNTWIHLQPMKSAGNRIELGTANWMWKTKMWYNSSTGWNYRAISTGANANEGQWSPSGGTYYGKDYGLQIVGDNNYGTGSDYSVLTEQPFTSNEPGSQWYSGYTGQIDIYNQIYAPRVRFDLTQMMANTSSAIDYTSVAKGMAFQTANSQSSTATITGQHAKGYRMWFLPYTYSYLSSWGIAGGRIEVYAKTKQSQSEITLGQAAS